MLTAYLQCARHTVLDAGNIAGDKKEQNQSKAEQTKQKKPCLHAAYILLHKTDNK